MKQFGTIFNFELKYYLKNKVFIGVTVFLVLLIAGVMFFPRVWAFFQSEEEAPTTPADGAVILLKADSAEKAETAAALFSAAFPEYNVQSTEDALDAIQNAVVTGEAECAFVLTSDTSYTYYVNNLSLYDMNTAVADEVLQQLYRMNAMTEAGMTMEEAGEILAVQIESQTESLGVNQAQNYWYTYIMIFALYMVILLYGQMVATNVASEKSSRAMEVLITSARPVSMMFGKVIASCLAGLLQLVAVFGSAFLFFRLNRDFWGDNIIINSIFDMPLSLLLFMLTFFVLGFFLYAFLFGAIGSTASKLEDINTSVMPVTMLFIISFIVVMVSMASGSVDTVLMKACSFIPFTSPMAMFTRIAMSTVPWHEIALSIGILIGSVFGVGVLSAKIYRVGVLLYGTTPKIGAILKAVRNA